MPCEAPNTRRNNVTGEFVYTAQEQRDVPPFFDWLSGMCGFRGRMWEKKSDEKIRIVS